MKRQGGYLTVYLSLCLSIIVSLYLFLLESAIRNGCEVEAICAVQSGMQSVLGEYNRALLDRYNLFALDSSYGTSLCRKDNVLDEYRKYVNANLFGQDGKRLSFLYKDFLGLSIQKAEMTQVSIMSDDKGNVFRNRAIEAIKDECGMSLFKDVLNWFDTVTINGLDVTDREAEQEMLNRKLEEFQGTEIQISDQEVCYIEIENPSDKVAAHKRKGILWLLTDNIRNLSDKSINVKGLIGERIKSGEYSKGNITVEETSGVLNRFLFHEYLLKYMGCFSEEKEESALAYEIEYILFGDGSDVNNLRHTANRIYAIREAANALYLISDSTKWEEIKVAATVTCGVFIAPGLIPVVESVILLAWASAESMHDLKQLFSGKDVPLLKDDNSWHYDLDSALAGIFGNDDEGKSIGLSYTDYLRILLMLGEEDSITIRAMDMIEANLRVLPGNRNFRMDACYDNFEILTEMKNKYGYEIKIDRAGKYE